MALFSATTLKDFFPNAHITIFTHSKFCDERVYKVFDNVITDIPYDFKLPGSYLFDFDFNGNEVEYPFENDTKLFDINKIIESVNKQR
jgi:hypothetical protein